ncbi:MAG: prepilin-type N-terminal cleavage/methylation domain-containing protein, partial [Terrimicrobiaceae bacterium]
MKIPIQTEFAGCRKISCLMALSRRRMGGGFTLVEILIAFAILSMIMVAMASLLNMTQNVSKNVSGKLDSFEAARTAFDTIGR